ncbi:MAG: SDR family NAD(P)-dependent oxidoreductase, partial [Rhodospirillaceae bacterium]|nr:SDR family NAD(P)-dependent oxidoreductase [Rhodospirillaceae bacterium]
MAKSVLVTGASKGIGAAIAQRLAADGFDIIVHFGGDEAGATATLAAVRAQGVDGRLLSFDISDRAQSADTLAADIAEHGMYWGVVLNAGISRDDAFPNLDGDDWDNVLRTNLDGFYNVLHPLVMPMVRTRNGGRIVAMTSVSGEIGNRGQVNYAASKAG